MSEKMNTPVMDTLEPDIVHRMTAGSVTRRSAIAQGAGASATLAAALRVGSVPVALAAMARNAFGQSARLPAVVISVLNFALVLERLEAAFYNTGVGTSGLIPGSDMAIFTTIQSHENAHVSALTTMLGSSARPAGTFNFTNSYPDVFRNYATFTAVAQALEDTGVRAYKGQAPALMPYKSVLTTALSIHSVEARHASEIRRLRGGLQNIGPNGKGWITRDVTDVPGAAAVYAGEANTVQGGVDLGSFGVDAVTEAFDEPLSMGEVLAIAGQFIV